MFFDIAVKIFSWIIPDHENFTTRNIIARKFYNTKISQHTVFYLCAAGPIVSLGSFQHRYIVWSDVSLLALATWTNFTYLSLLIYLPAPVWWWPLQAVAPPKFNSPPSRAPGHIYFHRRPSGAGCRPVSAGWLGPIVSVAGLPPGSYGTRQRWANMHGTGPLVACSDLNFANP